VLSFGTGGARMGPDLQSLAGWHRALTDDTIGPPQCRPTDLPDMLGLSRQKRLKAYRRRSSK
jgi:hypothetical protein